MAHLLDSLAAEGLSADTVCVGPAKWAGAAGAACVPDAAALARLIDGDEAGRLVLLHGGHLGVDGAGEEALACLDLMRTRSPASVAILLYDRIDGDTGVRLFRAGLLDALSVPAETAAWAETLRMARARQERRAAHHLLRVQATETSRRLRDHRSRLESAAATVGDAVLAAQEDLEQENRELSDHMAQLALLYKFGRELSSAANWDATLENLLGSLARFVGAAGAALVLRPAPDAPFAPRRTWRWRESACDRVLQRLEVERRRREATADVPAGVFLVPGEPDGEAAPVAALPLDYQDLGLGYLLLQDFDPAAAQGRFLPFLQAVQMILAEEVAGAQMLDRMRELGAFNARVLETVRSGIWVVDEHGCTIYANRSGRELLSGRAQDVALNAEPAPGIGRGRSAASGGATADFLREHTGRRDDIPELFLDGLLGLDGVEAPAFAHLAANAEPPFQGEGRLRRPDGRIIPVMVLASMMPGGGATAGWFVIVLEDLRETHKLAAEKMRADSLQSLVEMSATLAHEIRNPLMGLSAQAELLAENLPEGDRRKRYIDVITGEVDRIDDTITRMLNFVRPYEPRREAASLPALMRDCLDLAAPRASARSQTFALELSPDDPGASCWLQDIDAAQIKQVVLNLLCNACDAAPEGGAVTLRLVREDRLELADGDAGTTRQQPGCRIEVVDRGVGFAPETIEKLFRPFYTTKSAGTGLGLSLSRKIVDAHGGSLSAFRDGGETVFRILLPTPAADDNQQKQERA